MRPSNRPNAADRIALEIDAVATELRDAQSRLARVTEL